MEPLYGEIKNDEASTIRAVATHIDASFTKLYDMELITGHGIGDSTFPFGPLIHSDILVNESRRNVR